MLISRLIAALSALPLLAGVSSHAQILSCSQIATDPVAGLAGNPSIKDVKVALVASGAQDPNLAPPPGGPGRGRGPHPPIPLTAAC